MSTGHKMPSEAQILAAARALNKLQAVACNINEADSWAIYAESFKADARAALDAALAQPAADVPEARFGYMPAASGEPVAWMTHHEDPMVFPTWTETAQYCEDDESPIPLYAAPQPAPAPAAAPSDWIAAALSSPACRRLRDWYGIGPAQRAEVESFADLVCVPPQPAPARVPQWQPIETAPKDGSLFLCWVSAVRYGETDEGQQFQQDASQADFCSWRDGPSDLPGHGYLDPCCGQIGDSQDVTHWMPLPAAPTPQEPTRAEGG